MSLSNLPPGCTQRMIDAQFEEGPCECCGRSADDCICPECPVCHANGDPKCYRPVIPPVKGGRGAAKRARELASGHGLVFNSDQLQGQQRLKIADLKEQLSEAEMYLQWLIEHPHATATDID